MGVAGWWRVVLLLALAIHWLPMFCWGSRTRIQPAAVQTFNATLPLARGTDWRTIGPDWAQDISFTSNGALGYVCSVLSPDPIVFIGVYDVHQNTWKRLQLLPPQAVTAGCLSRQMLAITWYFPWTIVFLLWAAPIVIPRRELYDSYDGGETWAALPLPAVLNVYGAAWANATLFLAARRIMATGNTSIPPNAPSHLLVSQRDGTFAEIDAWQLVGSSTQFSDISLISSGATLYASLVGMSCASYCTIQVRSTDTGAHWTPFSANL